MIGAGYQRQLPAIVSPAAAATPAAAAVTAAAATATATATTAAPVLSLVDSDRPAVQLTAIHLLDGRLGIGGCLEGHESETTRTSSISVRDYLGFDDRTKSLECGPQAGIRSIPA